MSHSRVLLGVIGDVHHEIDALDRVVARLDGAGVDGVLLTGDLGRDLPFGVPRAEADEAAHRRSVSRVLERVGTLGVPVLWVPGNHDLRHLSCPGNVDGAAATVAGVRVAGIGGAGPRRFGFPYEWTEDEVRERSLPPCDVLLSHTPPRDTELDRTSWGGRHAGSAAVLERARAHDGVLVCGHIHEAAGAVQIGRCLCLNAGSLGAPFGRPQVAFVERDAALPGLWAVSHEDLDGGARRRWERRT